MFQMTFSGHTVTASLFDNTAAREHLAMRPLDLEIDDYSTYEKIAYLLSKLTKAKDVPFGNERPRDNMAFYYDAYRYSRGLIRLARFEEGSEPLLMRGAFPLCIEAVPGSNVFDPPVALKGNRMKTMISSPLSSLLVQRKLLAVTMSLAVVLCSLLFPASPALAHHGWPGFETNRLVYIAGTVSSKRTWGNPHSLFDVTLDTRLPADTPELSIPDELHNPEDSIRINSARSYTGTRDQLQIVIAPPAWSGKWGLSRALKVGERFQAVGYISRTDDGLFRPVVFWYGENAVPVNQVLGDMLPVRAPLPE